MILSLVNDAVAAGARRERACLQVGLAERSMQGWRRADVGDDRRAGPRTTMANALSSAERAHLLEVVNSPKYRDLPPKQVGPRLADDGRYIGSESTIYRILRAQGQDTHRGRAKPRTVRSVDAHVATAANQVWSWDITYLLSSLRGRFFYLYLVEDIWSRRIVGFEVHIECCPVDGRCRPADPRAATPENAPTKLVPVAPNPAGLAVDESGVYFASITSGTVYRVAPR